MYKGASSENARAYAFFDSMGVLISSGYNDSPNAYVTITCPQNTATVLFSSCAPINHEIPKLSVAKVSSNFDALASMFNSYNETQRQYPSIKASSGYMTNDGTIAENASYHCLYTDKIPASEGDKFLYLGQSSTVPVSVVFFNKGTVLSSAKYNSISAFVNLISEYTIQAVFYQPRRPACLHRWMHPASHKATP